MIRIDLTPPEIRVTGIGRARCHQLGSHLVILVAISALVNGYLAIYSRGADDRELEGLKDDVAALEQDLNDSVRSEDERLKKESQMRYARDSARQIPEFLSLLRVLPDRAVAVSLVNASPSQVLIRGHAADSEEASAFVSFIADYCPHTQVTVDELRMSVDSPEQIVSFTLLIKSAPSESDLLRCSSGRKEND